MERKSVYAESGRLKAAKEFGFQGKMISSKFCLSFQNVIVHQNERSVKFADGGSYFYLHLTLLE